LASGENADFLHAANELVHSALWPQLRALTVARGPFPWSAALANGRLRRLVLHGGSHLDRALTSALLSATGPATLEELSFLGLRPRGEELGEALASKALANLRCLVLRDCDLDNADLERLSRAPILTNLNRLVVGLGRGQNGAGLKALLASPALSGLTHLEIHRGPIPAPPVEALARNPSCRRLRVLGLWLRSAAALAALTKGEPFPELHTLRLHWCGSAPNPTALATLLRSRKLPRLCVVHFDVARSAVDKFAEACRSCARIAWAGGEVSIGGGERVAVKPQTVYLPNHLAEV
jgi:hypothetical protein